MDHLMQEFIEGTLDVTVSPARVPFTDVSNKVSKQGDKRQSSNRKCRKTKKKRKSDGPTGQVLFVSKHGGDVNARLDPMQPLMAETSSNNSEDQIVTEASPPPLNDIYWNEWDTHDEKRVSGNDIQKLLNELREVLMSQQKELLLRIKGIEETLQSNPLPTMSIDMETSRQLEHSTPNSMVHTPTSSSYCGVGGVDGQPPINWLLTIPPGKNEIKDNITDDGLTSLEEASWKYKNMLVENKFSTIAVKLAREVYFGDKTLKKCTPRGHGNFPALPHQKLNALKSALFEWYPKYWGNPKEFEQRWAMAQ